MQAFRSEGEIVSWCRQRGREPGEIFEPQQLWQLARRWYDDRLDLDWRRRTVAERQAILNDVGLVGPIWRIE